MDTEDKAAWCAHGAEQEIQFVNNSALAGITAAINPAKTTDKYSHDLLLTIPADLKSVRTPLFLADDLYGIDPQYAVTFNDKDGHRYARLYPNLLIVFDVRWDITRKELAGRARTVEPMHVTHAGFLNDVRRAIVEDGCKSLAYKRRVDDRAGNAQVSWVFDVRRLARLAPARSPE